MSNVLNVTVAVWPKIRVGLPGSISTQTLADPPFSFTVTAGVLILTVTAMQAFIIALWFRFFLKTHVRI